MDRLRVLALVSLIGSMLAAAPAAAQRIEFPSLVGQDPGIAAPPPPTLPGNAQPVFQGFDPYATTAPAPPPAILPQQGPVMSEGLIRPDGILVQPQRFLQQIRFENTYLARQNLQGLGWETLELNGSFALPLFARQPPFFVTPGFAVNYIDGPSSGAYTGSPDLPPRVFDAYLDTGWRPVVTPWLSGDLGIRVGVYSDFQKVNTHSIREIGRALGIITLSPAWQVAMGIVYLDRNRVKILPAGGAIWTPNPDVRWEMLFPRPKLAQRLTTLRNTDLWAYFAGEYGGGAWTIKRASGASDAIDYDDVRISLGLETRGINRLRGWVEVGFVFNRKVTYFQSATPGFKPGDTVMVRAGLAY